MKLKKLQNIIMPQLNSYYRVIQNAIFRGDVKIKDDELFLFPSIVLFTTTPQHLIIELIGYLDTFRSSEIRERRISSTTKYFDQFTDSDEEPALNIQSKFLLFENFTFSRINDISVLEKRFPIIKKQKQFANIKYPTGKGSLVKFGIKIGVITFLKCLFINSSKSINRIKFVRTAHVIQKDINSVEFKKFVNLDYNLEKVAFTTQKVGKFGKAYLKTGALQSLFLSKNIHETTIGSYLNSHQDILLNSLKGYSLIYEPTLVWKEKPTCEEIKPINPDFFIERSDRFYDIIDLKTALLEKQCLTTGKFSRRRFLSIVYDGIAQLANYLNYFDFKKNKDFAFEKYGIKVKEPKGILIIGSFDNYDTDKINQALRSHSNIWIIDYDTICQLYLKSLHRTK